MQIFSQSPTDAAFVQNPWPFYAKLRAAGDFAYWDDYTLPCATSHRAVSALLRDRRLGREIPADKRPQIPPHLEPFYAVEAHSMLELEAPRHTRLRRLVMRAFTSRRIKELGPEIDALARGLIAEFPSGPSGPTGPSGEFDLLPAFAQRIPVIVICRLLGVPEEKADDLLAWSNAMVMMYQAGRTHADELASAAATEAFVAFMRGYVDSRRGAPGDDLISALIAAEEDGASLSTNELITTCILLLNAGHEATVHAIGNAVKTICEQDVRTHCDAAGIDALCEETLRFDPPLHMFTRWAYEDFELYGQEFKAGDEIALLLACANRDAATWPEGERFLADRTPVPATSFGAGVHFCIGAPLARLELGIAVGRLFELCPNLRLSAPPRYSNSYHFHGLSQLMVTV